MDKPVDKQQRSSGGKRLAMSGEGASVGAAANKGAGPLRRWRCSSGLGVSLLAVIKRVSRPTGGVQVVAPSTPVR